MMAWDPYTLNMLMMLEKWGMIIYSKVLKFVKLCICLQCVHVFQNSLISAA